ncbi:hypothetical protein BG011_003499, partial [Mortierella polycephala]
MELVQASLDPSLRLATNAITAVEAKGLKLRYITERFGMHTPNVLSILNGLTSVNVSSSRDPSAIVSMIVSMLLILQNRKADYLQMISGIFLFSKGAPRRLIDVLSKAGMSVSHQSIMTGLKALTKDAHQTAKCVAKKES